MPLSEFYPQREFNPSSGTLNETMIRRKKKSLVKVIAPRHVQQLRVPTRFVVC